MAEISILIAHKHEPENDRALIIALDTLISNTACDYEILIDSTTPADPYRVYNRLAAQASSEWVVFSNSDVFFSKEWDTPLLDSAMPSRIVACVLVECGAIGVHPGNIHNNFGMRPDSFRRTEFEEWAATNPQFPEGTGWYFPSLHHRNTFLNVGGFDTTQGQFPDPIDIKYWNAWRDAGNQIVRVPSYVYHLQNYSSEVEQQKEVRGC